MDKKKALMSDWKKKCSLNGLIASYSSNYYNALDIVFGIPPIFMVSVVGILEGYGDQPESFFLTKLILSPLAALFKAVHFQCQFTTLAKDFKNAYNEYTSIKRDIDLYEVMDLTDQEILAKISEIKKRIELVKKSTPNPPWLVSRKFDEEKELIEMVEISTQLD